MLNHKTKNVVVGIKERSRRAIAGIIRQQVNKVLLQRQSVNQHHSRIHGSDGWHLLFDGSTAPRMSLSLSYEISSTERVLGASSYGPRMLKPCYLISYGERLAG